MQRGSLRVPTTTKEKPSSMLAQFPMSSIEKMQICFRAAKCGTTNHIYRKATRIIVWYELSQQGILMSGRSTTTGQITALHCWTNTRILQSRRSRVKKCSKSRESWRYRSHSTLESQWLQVDKTSRATWCILKSKCSNLKLSFNYRQIKISTWKLSFRVHFWCAKDW